MSADPFAEIRPYHDGEVRPVLDRLLKDPEMLGVLARLRLPKLYSWAPGLLRPLLASMLKRQFAGVHNVRDFQAVVKLYMDRMIEERMSHFSVSGLDALDPSESYLFLSNHRDIALDPAFVNYALYHSGHDTVRIAIGDNLLSKPFAADLMRLNKSFIVPRSARGPRQMLAAYRKLSKYIDHSIHEDRSSVWLAQREGRAKDGHDRTEPAVLKMLAMNQKGSELSFGEYMSRLRIVPVAISYEWDRCDQAKAKELAARANGEYEKAEHEDLSSIAQGILGDKGRVHVSFGQVMQGDWADAAELARAVDEQVLGNYVLHASNLVAHSRLHPDSSVAHLPGDLPQRPVDLADAQAQFNERLAELPETEQILLLNIYANVVEDKLNLVEATLNPC